MSSARAKKLIAPIAYSKVSVMTRSHCRVVKRRMRNRLVALELA